MAIECCRAQWERRGGSRKHGTCGILLDRRTTREHRAGSGWLRGYCQHWRAVGTSSLIRPRLRWSIEIRT
eukprot:1097428-Rhodomonas_salina.4